MSKLPRSKLGRFLPGHHYNRRTELKKGGKHWRPFRPWWTRDWCAFQYHILLRSAADIAWLYGLHENAVLYWLHKHGVRTRTISEARAVKPTWGHA